jgi:tight adherence protein B
VVSRRTLSTCVGLTFAVVTCLANPALGDAEVEIRGVDPSAFPRIALTISLEGMSDLSDADIELTENGVPVPVDAVRPIGSSGRGVDVFLAIDTSNSMRGLPLRTAFAAARTFVEQVPPWLRVGLLTFADTPQVVVPLSPEHEPVLQALQSLPATSQWTALYDAVTVATGEFTGAAQRNLILLTDGRNNTGVADEATAIEAATEASTTVFTVGLSGADTDEPALKRLARLSSGAFVSAAPDDLGAVYRSLAGRISQQFVITYRSRTPYGMQASVRVTLPGGTDEIAFLAPGLPSADEAATPTGAVQRLFAGPWAMPSTVVLSFLAALSLAMVLVGQQARRTRRRTLADRMAARQQTPPSMSAAAEASNPLTSWIPRSIVGIAGRMARSTGVAASVDRRLERAGLAMRPGEFVAGVMLLGIVSGGIIGAISRSLLLTIGAIAVCLIAPWLVLTSAERKRMRAIQAQLPDVLTVLASSLRAGHSFLQALDMVAKEVGEPASTEFARVVTEIRLGREVDDALEAMSGRIGSDDFRWAVMAIAIQRRVGGNLAEVLETVAETIRQREALRRQIHALSGEGRLSAIILTVLPLLIAAYIMVVNPDYLRTLVESSLGIALLVGAGILMIVGYLWMRRIIDVDA